MNDFQTMILAGQGSRTLRATQSLNKRAAAALKFAHSHAEFAGAVDARTLEMIMVAFGATRELKHG